MFVGVSIFNILDGISIHSGGGDPMGWCEEGQQMVGMVMVPMQPMQQAMQAGGVHQPYFPGCVVVPVGKFDRWPCAEVSGEPCGPAAPGKDVLCSRV